MIQSHKAVKILFAGTAIACMAPSAFPVNLTVNGGTKQGDVPHFWSRCVGTGGAQLCLKKEWKEAAKIGVAEAGFQAFRGHRILTASNPVGGNWNTFDQIYDFLVDSLHTVPVVELSSMPPSLQTSGEWSVPKDYNAWGNLIRDVVSHCITRYGKEKVRTWLWEVWNEWDYSGFWTNGTEAQYYQLYQKAVDGAKSVDPEILIGGPSTTGNGKLSNFLNYCKSNNVKVDLVTNHCYGGGGSGPNADPVAIRDDNRARAYAIKNFGKKLFSLNTEYSSSYSGQGGNGGANCYSMDNHKNAPFVVKCVKLILDDHTSGTYAAPEVLSYWVISDVFDEGSYIEGHNMVPFGQVFGLINYQGVRKATFNAFKMLHMMGATRLQLSGGSGEADGVDGFATLNENASEVAVIVYNFNKALDGSSGGSVSVNLTVNNLPLPQGKVAVRHYRVDETHSNAYGVWIKQGKPPKPSTSQWDEMRAASNLAELRPQATFNHSGNAYTDTFTLPRQSVSLLLFKSDAVPIVAKDPLSNKIPTLSLEGTMLRFAGSREKPIDIVLYSLDGRNMKRLRISGDFCDLRRMLPKGIFLVRARAQGASVLGKIVID